MHPNMLRKLKTPPYLAGELTMLLKPVIKLQGGPRGPSPPERPDVPHKTSVLRGYKGSWKSSPHEIVMS